MPFYTSSLTSWATFNYTSSGHNLCVRFSNSWDDKLFKVVEKFYQREKPVGEVKIFVENDITKVEREFCAKKVILTSKNVEIE